MNFLGVHILLQLNKHELATVCRILTQNDPGAQHKQKKTPLPVSGLRGQVFWKDHGTFA